MSCASSSRRLLQPFLYHRGLYNSNPDLFSFLCPRYSSTASFRQNSLSTNPATGDTDSRSKPVGHLPPRHFDKTIGNDEQDEHSKILPAPPRSKTDAVESLPLSHAISHNRGSKTFNGQRDLTLEKRNGDKESADEIASLPGSRSESWPPGLHQLENKQPSSTSTLDVKSDEHEALLPQDNKTGSNRLQVFELPGGPPQIAAPHANDVRRFVGEHLVNKSAKEWINSELRNRNTWSFDWIEPVQALIIKLQQNRNQSKEIYSDEQSLSFQLINNDYVGIPVSDIPIPSTWTKATFAQYVHDLSRSRMPQGLNRKLQKQSGRYHQEVVREYLENTLFTETNSFLMSPQAFESALRFFYRFEFVPSVQRLFTYMGEIQFPYPHKCFDIILRNAAMRKDLHNFTALLRGALDLGFIPDESTWASLFICLQSDRASEVVFGLMTQHRLLTDPIVRQDLAANMLNRRLSAHSFSVIDVEKILGDMDARLGSDWFSLRSANIILKYLCMSASAGQAIVKFLERMPSRGCTPNIDTLNILLRLCLRARNLGAAIDAFIGFHDAYRTIPDQLSYEILFELAWAKQSPNVCKILWAAACTHMRVSHLMVQGIMKSMARQESTQASSLKHWTLKAGSLTIGIDPRKHHKTYNWSKNLLPLMANDAGPQSIRSMILNLTSKAEFVQNGRANKMLIQALINHDQDLHTQFYYPLDLVKRQLKEALAKDEDWKANNIDEEPLDVQMEQLIRPELLRQGKRNNKSFRNDS